MHEFENRLAVFLMFLVVVVATAAISGKIAERMSQPWAVGELVVGILIGILINYVSPDFADYLDLEIGEYVRVLAQIGLVLLMFQVGMEFDFSILFKQRKYLFGVWLILTIGFVAPFLISVFIGSILNDGIGLNDISIYFCALAMSVTALPILGRILIEQKLQGSRLGVTVVAVAGLTDIIGWVILGGLGSYAEEDGTFSSQIVRLVIIISACIGIIILGMYCQSFLRTSNVSDGSRSSILVAFAFMSSSLTAFVGIFAVVGSFLFGVCMSRDKESLMHYRQKISPLVDILFVPAFFVYSGMQVSVPSDVNSEFIWGAISWTVIAQFAKLLPCAMAARFGGFSWLDSIRIGTLLNTRALMGLVVLNAGLEINILSTGLYSQLVIATLITTITTGPILNTITAYKTNKSLNYSVRT